MSRAVRVVVVLALVAGGALVAAPAAHATECNDADHDIWVGDPATVFVGVNNEPNNMGLCVRASNMGANVFIPIVAIEPQQGLHIYAADVKFCTVNMMAGPGERCGNVGAGVTIDENEPAVHPSTYNCVDPNPEEPFLWTCVTGGITVGNPWFFYVCVQAAGGLVCVIPPPL